MNQSVLTMTPGGLALGQSLGFTAAAVVVDNYTSNYLTLSDVGKTIPPWTYGAVVPLPDGIRQANAVLTPTVPAIPGPPVPKQQAVLTWTDEQLLANPGQLLQQSQYGVQNVLGTVAGGANSTAGPTSFAVPAGTMSIGYMVRNDQSRGTPQKVTIVGDQSNSTYVAEVPIGAIGGPIWVPFAASDTSVSVTVTTNASSASAVDVLASPNIEAVDVREPTPAPWQSPNLRPIRFAGTFPTTQATARELVFGSGAQRVWIFDLSLTWDTTTATSSLHLVDGPPGNPSAGTVFADMSMVPLSPQPFRLGGPLTAGNSLFAYSDSAVVARGWLSASLG